MECINILEKRFRRYGTLRCYFSDLYHWAQPVMKFTFPFFLSHWSKKFWGSFTIAYKSSPICWGNVGLKIVLLCVVCRTGCADYSGSLKEVSSRCERSGFGIPIDSMEQRRIMLLSHWQIRWWRTGRTWQVMRCVLNFLGVRHVCQAEEAH